MSFVDIQQTCAFITVPFTRENIISLLPDNCYLSIMTPISLSRIIVDRLISLKEILASFLNCHHTSTVNDISGYVGQTV